MQLFSVRQIAIGQESGPVRAAQSGSAKTSVISPQDSTLIIPGQRDSYQFILGLAAVAQRFGDALAIGGGGTKAGHNLGR